MKRIKRVIAAVLCLVILSGCGALGEPLVTVPDEYTATGTLPVYAAHERDFSGLVQPEWFNPSGIARQETGKKGRQTVFFNDEAQLDWDADSLYYNAYHGVDEFEYELAKNGEKYTEQLPKPTLANAAGSLASWMLFGWPETNEVYALEKQSLTHISLEEAKTMAEKLLNDLGLSGYRCEAAIDMDLKRIQTMGDKWNDLIDRGVMLNNHRQDYTQATTEDEGYLLKYNRFGRDSDLAGMFHADLYVTAKGFVSVNLYDMYAVGEKLHTPQKLMSWQEAAKTLPTELKESRSALILDEIKSVSLNWCPVRHKEAKSGMAFTPAWIFNFNCDNDEQNSDHYYAVFDAQDGRLIDSNWY